MIHDHIRQKRCLPLYLHFGALKVDVAHTAIIRTLHDPLLRLRVVDREASARMSNLRKGGGCLRKGVCFGGWRRLGVGRFILGTFHSKQRKETAKEKRKTEGEEENLVTGTRRRASHNIHTTLLIHISTIKLANNVSIFQSPSSTA
nr:hypothetical protein Itr_chr02CG09900 [Ipomoea trifida]